MASPTLRLVWTDLLLHFWTPVASLWWEQNIGNQIKPNAPCPPKAERLMTLKITIAGMATCVLVWALATWREKNTLLGQVPFIPHIYYKYSALILLLVLTANLVSLLTGVEWEPGFRR